MEEVLAKTWIWSSLGIDNHIWLTSLTSCKFSSATLFKEQERSNDFDHLVRLIASAGFLHAIISQLQKSQMISMDRTNSVVLDIEKLIQSSDVSSGSPTKIRALARKNSYRMDRRSGVEEEEIEVASKKLLLKVNSHLEPLISNKIVQPATTIQIDMSDGRSKRFNRLTALNPRKILLIFATASSMGTMILIYFTLAISRRNI